MCDKCVQNWVVLPEAMKNELASRCRALGSAMCQGAQDGGYDGVEMLAALEVSARYLRMQMDAGIQELAQAVADRILPRIVAEARARGVELAPPKEHPPVTFMSVAVVHVVEVETKESPRVKDPGDRPAREPLAGPPRRLPRKLRN